MADAKIPESDVIPHGGGLRIECCYPVADCSIACMKDMTCVSYSEDVHVSGNKKNVYIKPLPGCDYQMQHGLYIVATNICKVCHMRAQANR